MFRWRAVCGTRPAVMGIVNVTPDSFSDGGRYFDRDAAVAHGAMLADEGADLVDVGGESTRPGAEPVPAEEECRRAVPVIERLAAAVPVPVSVDTTKASVAAAALGAGATIVNDVSAGRFDPELLEVVASGGAGYVVMHMLGEPRTMQDDPRYDDVVDDVSAFLVARLEVARAAGIRDDALVADPGIGFGKTVRHNLELLARLPVLAQRVGVPLLVGPSRKSFIGLFLGERTSAPEPLPMSEREEGTLALVAWAVEHGARVVRVHTVRPAVHTIRLLEAMQTAGEDAA